ncbi:MAG: AAA family ATPase [Desulfobacterota bacterium]|nr:AAA family ATPase [Thermodesulfobacteriota bacterium]MDW8002463.1 AAA family ATPase [Deltaproteobacteria bacterium]
MARKIVVTGRGGSGKSTFVALISRFLSKPSLLIDLDPDLSLADMLGIDLEKEKKRTVIEVLYDVVDERKRGGDPLVPVEDKFKGLIWTEALYEGRGFDLIVLGTKDMEGCYCFPDHLMRKTISDLVKNYKNVVIDSPAGLEHLNRNIVSEIDYLFVIIDPSEKSIAHIKRVKEIAKEVGIKYANFNVVGNYMFTESDEKFFEDKNLSYIGRIEYDRTVEELNLKGESLRSIPDDSPAVISAKKILEKARLI